MGGLACVCGYKNNKTQCVCNVFNIALVSTNACSIVFIRKNAATWFLSVNLMFYLSICMRRLNSSHVGNTDAARAQLWTLQAGVGDAARRVERDPVRARRGRCRMTLVNQATNQSINQSIYHSTNLSINLSICLSIVPSNLI